MTNESTTIYSRVTEKILADLKRGTRPWLKPWDDNHSACVLQRPRRHNGEFYRGINTLLLWAEASEKGYGSNIWMTYRQAGEFGAQVRKGEKGSLVVYADSLTRTETDDSGEEQERVIPFMKGYTVFNADQIDGLPERFQPQTQPVAFSGLEQAALFFASTKAIIRHGGNRAYYAPLADYIQMPPQAAFTSAESYAATLAHELTHWTSHETRLNRTFEGGKTFASEGYAKEELVAELGAAFLCADLGLSPEARDDHAAYIASWQKAMQNDTKFIFTAASHAQRAVDFLHALQPQTKEEAA